MSRVFRKLSRIDYSWIILPLFFVSITFGLCLGILRYNQVSPITADPVSLLEPECNGDPNSQGCLRQKYGQLTETLGAKATYEQLKADYASNQAVYNDCHQITHVIGRTVAKKVSDVGEAFLQGDSFCWSGFHHGVMEILVTKQGLSGLLQNADQICQSLRQTRRNSFDHYNCVHGLGHGVMALFGNELFAALDGCDNLSDDWERRSCYGGVYMENIISEGDASRPSKYLDKTRPMYPCTDVIDKYKQECYMMQTSFALQNNGYDFLQTFKLCSEIDQSFVTTCYQSLGRDASGSTVSNVEKSVNICNLGIDSTQRQNCLIGAVKDFISFHHDIVQANQLCQAAQPEDFVICQSTAESYYQTL